MRTFAVLFLSLVLVGGLKADDKLANPTPGKCPVGGKDIKEGVVSEHDGKKYGLCCNGCKKKFDADPKKFLEKKEEKK